MPTSGQQDNNFQTEQNHKYIDRSLCPPQILKPLSFGLFGTAEGRPLTATLIDGF